MPSPCKITEDKEEQDARKNKRESSQDDSVAGQENKKHRSQQRAYGKKKSHRRLSETAVKPSIVQLTPEVAASKVIPVEDAEDANDGNKYPHDIEGALHKICRVDTSKKEYISKDSWIVFRVGHTGDVLSLASFYQKINPREELKMCASGDDTSMEVFLAEGLGDEDSPSFLFALIVDVFFNDRPKILGGAALFSLAWADKKRRIQIECCFFDKDVPDCTIVERRMWLRLSSLALMTDCDITSRCTE